MDRSNMSKFWSNDRNALPVTNRPKVVLINPNFQRKQTSAGKTIYVNPFFKPTPTSSKQDVNLATSLCSIESKYEIIQPCTSASLANTPNSSNQNLQFVNENPKAFNPILKSCISFNNVNGTAITPNSSRPTFKRGDRAASVVSKITPRQTSVSQNSIGSRIFQPKKTYVNPKFLRAHENTDAVVQKKAPCFHVNVKKLKLDNETSGVQDNHLLKLEYSSVESENKMSLSLIDNAMTQISLKESAPPSIISCSDSQGKVSVDSHPATTSTCLPVSPSPWSAKSCQKKKMHLLRLQKITRLAQLAQLSRLRKKDISSKVHIQSESTNLEKNVALSNKSTFKQSSSKKMSDVQNSVCHIKNNFLSQGVSSHSQSFPDICNTRSDGPSVRIHQHQTYQRLFKKCSKFKIVKSEAQKYHLVLKFSSNKSQSGSVNNLNRSDQPTSKSNLIPGKNVVHFYPKKFVKINEKQHQNSTQDSNNMKQEFSLDSQAKENIASSHTLSSSQKLLHVSNKKLIRKPATKKDLHQKNRSCVFKNKYIIRNINLAQSKNEAACFKINFKPSRTSSDVIHKRIMQRKVINRYKLLNVPQNLVKAENSSTSSVVPEKLTSQGKCIVLAEESKNYVGKSKNSSFISIGKTKLIHKSVLKRKQRSTRNNSNRRKVRANSLKLVNAAVSNDLKKVNPQNFSTKSTEISKSTKPISNNLIAFGKTKLIKQSLLHWQRQVRELRTKRSNVAAASVIQKRLKKLYKSLPEKHQNIKLLKKVPVSKQKLTNSPSFMKNKLLTKRRIALRCKNNIPCEIFHRFGICKKITLGKCFKLHDKKYVAICQAFIQGTCKNNSCLLSHEIIPQKMPTCHHFLQGACSRDNCSYPHVKLSAKASVCRDFVRGFCSLGLDCDKLHVLVCPEAEKNGFCTNRPNCKFAHRKKKKTALSESSVKKETSNSDATEQSSITGNVNDFGLESCNEPMKRYFSKSSENELESYIPERPQLGSLPSFIPLNSCDTLIKINLCK